LALWYANDPRMFHALGIFIATFVYALWMMAWVNRGGNGTVPLMSSLVVVALLMASTYVFALLIRGLSELQITNTLHSIGGRGRLVIDQMYRTLDRNNSKHDIASSVESARNVPVSQTVQYVGEPRAIARLDTAALIRMAERGNAIIEVMCAVGDTLSDNTPLIKVRGANAQLSEGHMLGAFQLNRERTFEQDPKYALRLLVDIAIKALSPAINDPTTAVQAIDQIEDLMRRLARHDLDTGYCKDANGMVRIIFPVPTWEDYLHLSFDEIRQFGASSVQVLRRLRSALIAVAETVTEEARAAAVQAYLRQLDLGILHSPLDAADQVFASQEDRQGLGLSRRSAV
jgi:uncharacterized membrane protein